MKTTKIMKGTKKINVLNLIAVLLVLCVLTAGCGGSGGMATQSYDDESYREEDSGAYDSYDGGVAGDQAYDMETEDGMSPESFSNEDVAMAKKGATAEAADSSQAQGDDGTGSGQADPAQQTEQTEQTAEAKKAKKEEKLVYTCDLTIETITYKETMAEIEEQIKAFSGIIESQNEYDNDSGWYINGHTKTAGTLESTITVRIPSKDYQAFLKSLDGKGKMTHKSMNVTNISRTYYDTSAAIEALKIQEKRLLKMMDEAKTIEDMIRVEDRLTQVQTELNQYRTRLESMDTQVAYSTVTMTIREVLEYQITQEGKKTNTFIERLKNTFEESWSGFLSFMEGLLFFFIRIFPFAVIAAVLWFVTRPLRMWFSVRRQVKKEEKRRRKEEYAMREDAGKEKRHLPFGRKKKEDGEDIQKAEPEAGKETFETAEPVPEKAEESLTEEGKQD